MHYKDLVLEYTPMFVLPDIFPGLAGWERRVFTVGQEADWDGWREREGHRTCTAIVGQEGRGERPGPGPVVVDHNVTQDALYGLASVLE